MNIPKALGTPFFIEHEDYMVTAVELSFSIRKEFLKKKVSGEIAFALICLIHEQIQFPARSNATIPFVFLAKFAEFYYHKRFQTRSQ